MASLHRKLLHKPKPLVCPTGCSRGDPLNNGCIRPCFAIPPPPPPPPLIHGSSNHAHFPPSLFITLYSFFGFVFLISISFILWKMCSRRNSSGPAEVDTASDDNNDAENFWENHHHVWLINTVGLPQSAIDSISVCKFKPGDGLIEGTECSVCLSEFEEDENLRLLPKCSHGFHLPCIDPWLRSHKNCPLCRAPVEIDAKINSNSDRHSDDSAVAEESQVENHGNFENRGEDGGIGIGIGIGSNDSVDLGSGSENGGITGDARAVEVKNPNSNSNSNSGFVEKKRSGSSRLLGCELMKSCSLGRRRNLQMGPVSMKRSFSSGRLLFVSRENKRKRSASTLLPF